MALFEQRLDPLTKKRIGRLNVPCGAGCLEIGGGHGAITRWLADYVGPSGKVTATDLQFGFLQAVEAANVEVIRHDIRTDTFPERSFDLIHTRAVLMHVPDDSAMLSRLTSWLVPGGWLLLEEPDFGMWIGDADELWASCGRPPSPASREESFASSDLG